MRITFIVLVAALRLCAQGPQTTIGSLAGSGYRSASPSIEAAPGQVLIVSIHGAKARLTGPVVGTPELPNLAKTVAGFSAQLIQSRGRTPVGIFGVSQSECRTGIVPCSPVTNITLQVPFELVASGNNYAALEFSEANVVVADVAIQPVTDKVHVVNACDDSLIFYSVLGDADDDACTAAVTRPQGGGLIKPRNPVRPGDVLIAFAHGMGDTNPTPAYNEFHPGPTKQPFIMRYAVAGGPHFWAEAPISATLFNAQGHYQINFRVPPLPVDRPLPACGELGLYGNVKVSISGMHSTDTFDLCVQP